MSVKKVVTDNKKKWPKGFYYELDLRQKGYKRIREPYKEKKDAEDAEAAIKTDRQRNKHHLPAKGEEAVTLKTLIDKHLEEVKDRPTSQAKLKNYLYKFMNLAGGESRKVESLRVNDIQKYIQARKKTGIKNQTINRELNEIRACLNAAWKYYRNLETFRCPRYEKLQEPEDGRRQTWEPEQIEAVLKELLRPAQPRERQWQLEHRRSVAELFILAQETGLRSGEARKLHRSQVNLKRRVLIITSYKGKRPKTREVEMNDTVFSIISRRYEECEWLFPSKDKKKPIQSYYKSFKAACDRAGVLYGKGVEGSLIFNDARRTFVNLALEEQRSIRALTDTTGHSIQTMARHYARSTRNQKKEVVETGRNYGLFLDATPPPTPLTPPLLEKQDNS